MAQTLIFSRLSGKVGYSDSAGITQTLISSTLSGKTVYSNTALSGKKVYSESAIEESRAKYHLPTRYLSVQNLISITVSRP